MILNTRIPHSLYQERLGEKLTSWLRRRSRPLRPEWLQAARLLLRINLDPLRAELDALYSPSPRGRPPYDPICLLRALLLMLLLNYQRFDRFADDLRRNPRLAHIAGFKPGQTPSTGTFYHFIDRLEDGPFQPSCSHRVRPSQLRKLHRARQLKQEKAERDAQRQAILAQSDSITSHLSEQLLAASDSPRPRDLQQRLEDFLLKAAVIPSARRGLLGDMRHLILTGDGSSLPTGASPWGQPTCQCRADGIYRCTCPRVYSDPTADWGWDSYRKVYFFGHTYYQHLVSTRGGHDLPVHVTLGPASETDFTLSLKSLDRFFKACRENQLDLSVEATAYDCGHDARGIYDYLLEKTIAPVIVLNPRSGDIAPSGTAQTVNDHGVPLCQAGLPMRRHSTTPNHRILFHCPVKRPTHSHGAHAWNAHPDDCPLKLLCQPDTKMGPVVYVRADSDPRFYPPIPRHSSRFKQILNLRSGCERSNSTKKVAHHLGARPCRSATHFLVRLYLVSILEHARAWLAEDQKQLGPDWDQAAELMLLASFTDAA